MAMSRKDFESIAKTLKTAWFAAKTQEELNTLQTLIFDMSESLLESNPRFDPKRFREACFSR
jgi:hypothetical protein